LRELGAELVDLLLNHQQGLIFFSLRKQDFEMAQEKPT